MPKYQPINRGVKMRPIHSTENNFGLTQEEFERFVINIKSGDNSFFKDVLANHLPNAMSYLKSKYTVSHDEAYDTCLDTFVSFRNKIINDKIKYGNLRFLFTRMCSNAFIDRRKKVAKTNESISVFLTQCESNQVEQEAFFESLDKAVAELNTDQQLLVRQIFYSKKTLKQIAEETGQSYDGLRKRKERVLRVIRENIRKYI